MNNTEQWQDMQNLWREGDELFANDTSDAEHVLEELRVLKKNQSRELWTASLVGFALSAGILIEVIKGLPSLMDYFLYSVFLVISLTMTIANIWYRHHLNKSKMAQTADYIDELIYRYRMNSKLLKIQFYGTSMLRIIAGLLMILMIWIWWTKPEFESKHWLVSAVVLLCFFIFTWVSRLSKSKSMELRGRADVLEKVK